VDTTASQISIRLATSEDDSTLIRLAALDSAPAPRGAVLVADVDGEIVAAYSLTKARSIADPFRATADVRELLELRARQALSFPRAPAAPRLPALLGRRRGSTPQYAVVLMRCLGIAL
jgi:hypothetical protein